MRLGAVIDDGGGYAGIGTGIDRITDTGQRVGGWLDDGGGIGAGLDRQNAGIESRTGMTPGG